MCRSYLDVNYTNGGRGGGYWSGWAGRGGASDVRVGVRVIKLLLLYGFFICGLESSVFCRFSHRLFCV